jgi:hypothetical protein
MDFSFIRIQSRREGTPDRTAIRGFESGERVGQDSRHQTIALPAIIELGARRQSMIDAVAKFERA